MLSRRAAWRAASIACVLAACRRDPPPTTADVVRDAAPLVASTGRPPVPLDANTPLVYPPALLRAGIEGTVLMRLFVNAQGTVFRDSIRIAESSGYPAFDSAALAVAPKLHFAPALRGDSPIAAPFLQPFLFRKPARPGETP